MASEPAVGSSSDIVMMKDEFDSLEKLFDSIVEGILDPEKAKTFVNPFVVEKAKRGNVSQVAYNVASVTEAVSVIIIKTADDGMKAYAKVVANTTSFKPFTDKDIKRAANENRVFRGIDEAAIAKMVRDQVVNTDVLIAEGTPPKNGKDGSVEMNFEVSEEISVPNVQKGAEICRIRPAKKGRNGEDVTGRIIEAADGKEPDFPIGDGIKINAGRATAEFDGTLVYRNGHYSIVNELIIDKNVTRADGIIGFAGTIIINGSVTGNCVIKAGRNVEVRGFVSNSLIEAEESVTVTGKILSSTVRAKNGNVEAGEITDSTVNAGGSLKAEFICNSEVKCIRGITCTEGLGKIQGGNTYCAGDINCLTVGSRERVETVIVMGETAEFEAERKKIGLMIEKINTEITTLNDQVNLLYEKKKNGTATLEDDAFISAASNIKQQKLQERIPLTEELKSLESVIEIASKATLKAKVMVYGGAIIKIRGCEQVFNSDKPRATVRANGANIVVT